MWWWLLKRWSWLTATRSLGQLIHDGFPSPHVVVVLPAGELGDLELPPLIHDVGLKPRAAQRGAERNQHKQPLEIIRILRRIHPLQLQTGMLELTQRGSRRSRPRPVVVEEETSQFGFKSTAAHTVAVENA